MLWAHSRWCKYIFVYKIWKRGGRQYKVNLHKIGGLAPLCQLCKETLKSFHSPLAPHPISGSPPPFLVKNFDSPHYSHFLKIFKYKGAALILTMPITQICNLSIKLSHFLKDCKVAKFKPHLTSSDSLRDYRKSNTWPNYELFNRK